MTVLRCLLLASGLLISGVGAIVAAPDRGVVFGVNVVNPQRLGAADREGVLDQLQAAGVYLIRVPLMPAWNASDFGPGIDFIHRAYMRGIKTDLIVGLQYRENAQRRPAVSDMPKMWLSFPLSAADPTRFRTVFKPLFVQLEGMGVTFAALELGNEINWTAFNGDFPIPGEGRIFGRDDLAKDPETRRVAQGFRAYLQTLRVFKDIRDHSRLNRVTPIISAGLSDPGFAGPRPGSKLDAVTIGATLDYLRANGLDRLVDAYGVHTYPSPRSSAAARLGLLERDTLAECRRSGQGKPCWVTEWGLPAGSAAGCGRDDGSRAAMMAETLANFQEFAREGRLKGILYYAWADDRYGIYRCGAQTESARMLLDAEEAE
jgi:hypothetical protein